MLSQLTVTVVQSVTAFTFQYALLWVIFALVWPFLTSLRVYLRQPSKILALDHTLIFGIIYSNIVFIFNGPSLIDRAYAKARGRHFAIPALREYQVLVTSEEHLRDVNNAPVDQLSFYDAMNDRVRFSDTCHGLKVGVGSVDPQGLIPQKTFKLHLRKHLPEMTSRFQWGIEAGFSAAISQKLLAGGWKSASIFTLAEEICTRTNNQALMGEDLAYNVEFHQASIRYGHDFLAAMEMARHVPEFAVSTFITAIMSWSGARDKVISMLTATMEQRLKTWSKDNEASQPKDCLSWVIAASTGPGQREVKRLVQQMLGLMFASAHQMPMALTYVLYDLCDHPEFITPLREEAENMLNSSNVDFSQYMPRMESFLRESARCNPLDALTVQRKAIQDFHFSDGSMVPRGNLVAVAQKCVMRDSRYYSQPDTFDGARFLSSTLEEETSKTQSRLTDINLTFPYWGAPKRQCAGRWYASYAFKQTFSHLLANYDFELVSKTAPRTRVWTTAVFPRRAPRILLRERQ